MTAYDGVQAITDLAAGIAPEKNEAAENANEYAENPPEPDVGDVTRRLNDEMINRLDNPPGPGATPEEIEQYQEALCCNLKALAALISAQSAGAAGSAGGAGGGTSGGKRLVIGDRGDQNLLAPNTIYVRSDTRIWCLHVHSKEWKLWDAGEAIIEVLPHGHAILIRSKSKATVFNTIRGSYSEPTLNTGAPLVEAAIS